MWILILRPLVSVGLAAAFTTTGLQASNTVADRSPASQTQTSRAPDQEVKPAKAAKAPKAAKRTLGTNPAMPLWEGPWGPHH